MDKFAKMALLYDFYSPLLTPKQRDSLDFYYQQDFSLGEIAEEGGTSRQAVYDLLKRSEMILLEYERKLRLVDKHLEQQKKLSEIKNLLDQIPQPDSLVQAALSLVDELLAKE